MLDNKINEKINIEKINKTNKIINETLKIINNYKKEILKKNNIPDKY